MLRKVVDPLSGKLYLGLFLNLMYNTQVSGQLKSWREGGGGGEVGEATSRILPVTEGPKFFLDITKNYR